jgi:CubicO group peptidase (beta-lactamase class C family)
LNPFTIYMMKIRDLLLFLLLLIITKTQAQNDVLAAELDIFIQDQMMLQSIPGLSASIVKEGQIIWKSAYGTANFETSTPVSLETEFTLASISKLFTATACAQLWETGLLNIDEDINNYLPISIVNPNFTSIPITVRQLLQHKSSLHDYESDLQLWDQIGDPMFSLSEFCANYFVEGGSLYKASNFANTAPGASPYWYSNAGFTLLGYIVEVVSATPFNEYCKINIQTPLQMNTAGWFYSEININDLAMPYDLSFHPYGYFSVPEYPAAMLKANILELSNFLLAITQHGNFQGTQIISSATFSTMLPTSMTNGFAWWGTDTWYGDPLGNYWSHGGYMNGVRTQINYYPTEATGLIILTNGEGNYFSIQNKIESYIPLFQVLQAETIAFNEPKIHFYPNPVKQNEEVFFIADKDILFPLEIEIMDILGKKRSHITINKQKQNIDLSSYVKGFYLIKYMLNGKNHCKKIIID